MSSTFKIFQKHYVELVRRLPMDDVTFIGELFKSELLPNDLKAKLKSLSTPRDKAAKFLDDVIEPGVQAEYDSGETSNQFTTLLSVMRTSGNDNVEKLAETIMAELNHKSSSSCDAIGEELIIVMVVNISYTSLTQLRMKIIHLCSVLLTQCWLLILITQSKG